LKGARKAVEGPLSFASATAGVTVVASVVAVPFSSKTTGLFFLGKLWQGRTWEAGMKTGR